MENAKDDNSTPQSESSSDWSGVVDPKNQMITPIKQPARTRGKVSMFNFEPNESEDSWKPAKHRTKKVKYAESPQHDTPLVLTERVSNASDGLLLSGIKLQESSNTRS